MSRDELNFFPRPKDFYALYVDWSPTKNMFQKNVDGAFKAPTLDDAIVRWWPETDTNWLRGINGDNAKEFSYAKTKTRSFDPFAPKVEEVSLGWHTTLPFQ